MISVSEAEKIVLQNAKLLPYEAVSLTEAYGRVLRESIRFDRDQPAFNKSTMDGIAVSVNAVKFGVKKFAVEGVVAAGQKPSKRKKHNGCFRIMTGAVVPSGCDCVIPVEKVSFQGKQAVISSDATMVHGCNIRWQGADHKKGTVLFERTVPISI